MTALIKSAFILLMLKNVISAQKVAASDSTCTKPNEEFQQCGTACPLTCENIKEPPSVCTEQCIIGCGCKPSFIRDTITGNCVSPVNCTGLKILKYSVIRI